MTYDLLPSALLHRSYPTCRATEKNDSLPDDPFGQLAWLDQRLVNATAAGAKVYILGHIPPCVDSDSDKAFWHSQYVVAPCRLKHPRSQLHTYERTRHQLELSLRSFDSYSFTARDTK
jgi:hypothetical protein